MENTNLNFSFDNLLHQTNITSNNLLAHLLKNNFIISVKVSFQDEHIIYKCPDIGVYGSLINKLENDYNYDNYILAVYKHYYKDEKVITDIIIPRNTTLLEDDFIGSLEDLPF